MGQQEHPEGSSAPGGGVGILGKIWETWKRVGRIIGDMIARVILTLFYVTLFVPFAVGTRVFADPLGMKARSAASHWLQRSTGDLVLDDARRQF